MKVSLALLLLYPIQYAVSGNDCQISVMTRNDQCRWRQVADCTMPAFADSRAHNDISQAVQVADDSSCQLMILKHIC